MAKQLSFRFDTSALKEFKAKYNYTIENIEHMLNVSGSHVSNVLAGKTNFTPSAYERFTHIRRMKEIIDGEPEDKRLLIKELNEYMDGGIIVKTRV